MTGVLAVRAPNWVGDLVMATPVLHAALAQRGAERTRIVLRAHLAPLLAGGELEPLLVPVRSGDEEIEALRAMRAEEILLLATGTGSALRAWRAGIAARIGSAAGLGQFLLTKRVQPPRDGLRRVARPTAQAQLELARAAGIAVQDERLRLDTRPADEERVGAQLDELGLAGRAYLVLCPGAAGGASKLWPTSRFAEAARAIAARHGLAVVVSGGPREERLMDEAAALVPGALNLASLPRDLHGLKALVRGARLVLVGDSGPRWIAAAFGVPCVSVMGPNMPELTASSLERARIVRRDDLPCAPCMERRCPLGHHACLRGLQPERVVSAASELLG